MVHTSNEGGTKWLGRYQVQASCFMAQVIVLVIINAMISNDWKIGIMEESKNSQNKYCFIVITRRNVAHDHMIINTLKNSQRILYNG